MVMFHSYVKLPEGTMKYFIYLYIVANPYENEIMNAEYIIFSFWIGCSSSAVRGYPRIENDSSRHMFCPKTRAVCRTYPLLNKQFAIENGPLK